MKSDIRSIAGVFQNGGNTHFVLPHFQREYVWDKPEWKDLVRDLSFLYKDHALQNFDPEKVPIHFLGMIVVTYDSMKSTTLPAYKLIDGQQRIITISLMLCALRDLTKRKEKEFRDKIDIMLHNPLEHGNAHLKVFPSTRHGDYAAYTALLAGTPQKTNSSRITKAYLYLRREFTRLMAQHQFSPEHLYVLIMRGFQVVFVHLEEESPYKIYESLDGKGKVLSQADSIRNYIAMMLPASFQEEVFERDWSKIEAFFTEHNNLGKIGELTAFLRQYLAMRRGILYPEETVYIRFRDYIEQVHPTSHAFIQEIGTLRQFAEYYQKIVCPEQEPREVLRHALMRLNLLDATPTYSLLLAAYEALFQGTITPGDMLGLLTMLENLFVRRYLCGQSQGSLQKWFPGLWQDIAHLHTTCPFPLACRRVLTGKYYPLDQHLRQATPELKLYTGKSHHRKKLTFILLTIEEHLWAHTDVSPHLKGLATIEHIMPQILNEQWKADLGMHGKRIHEDYLHTLGNLTLVTQAKNAQLSNAAFTTKRGMLLEQGLKINQYFTENLITWDERAIHLRAEWLTHHILHIWPSLTEPAALST